MSEDVCFVVDKLHSGKRPPIWSCKFGKFGYRRLLKLERLLTIWVCETQTKSSKYMYVWKSFTKNERALQFARLKILFFLTLFKSWIYSLCNLIGFPWVVWCFELLTFENPFHLHTTQSCVKIDLYHGAAILIFSCLNKYNRTEASRKIVWFLFVQWILAFITVTGYREHYPKWWQAW